MTNCFSVVGARSPLYSRSWYNLLQICCEMFTLHCTEKTLEKCTLFLLLFHSLFHLNFLLGKKIYWDLHGWLINERFPRGINHRLIWKGRLSLEKQAVQKNISASHNCYCKNRSFLLGKLLSKYLYVLHDCLILREIHFGFNPSEIQFLFLSCKYSTFWVDPGSRMVTCIWKIWLEQVEPIH